MDKVFLRNFLLFIGILSVCSGMLSYYLVRSDNSLDKTDDLVLQTYEIISEAESLSSQVEGMLSAQRGYILSKKEKFLNEYEAKKADVSNHIATLSLLSKESPDQVSRLDEIRHHFSQFSTKLEERAEHINPEQDVDILKGVDVIDSVKDNILRINNALLNRAYNNLDLRIKALESKRSTYFYTLLIGIAVGTILLLLFNGFLLRAQSKRNLIEASLEDTEKRFAIAVEGTQDGIFDWNLRDDTVFYSRRFFEMLGYERTEEQGNYESFKQHVHADDIDRVETYLNQYLDGELSEYIQEFRMKHKSGHWVWIQSRAKRLLDKKGIPYRMVGVHTDITHLVKAKQKLEAEKEEAESSNRAKSEFLAHMSHEIRTPLTAISGIAEIFSKRQDNLNEKQKHLVSTLNSSSAALKDLVNDILDFSKIESGELELDEEAFTLERLFQEVISMMALRANEKCISFLFDYSDVKTADFYGDKKRLRQILINLIGNALKFTDAGGVTVKASFEDRDGNDFLRIDVADTGIGIAPENFDLVFERFKQADSSVSRRYGGTGLGLPISKNLAELMGGDIFLSSAIGKGSTFSVMLPQKLEQSDPTLLDKVKTNKKLNDKLQASLHDEAKILLVEDYEGNVVVIGCLLEDIGLSYDVAYNGREAVEAWQENHYDLILMDVQMPEMDGFAATSEIRRIEKEQNMARTPLIGMTAHALIGDKDKCIDVGMDSYLPKPLVETDLKREILKYLDRKKLAA